jgi:hypothetical protein
MGSPAASRRCQASSCVFRSLAGPRGRWAGILYENTVFAVISLRPKGRPAFRCHCGHQVADRVTVERSSGSAYRTAFVACARCRAMFHWPGLDPVCDGPSETYGAAPSGAPNHGLSEDQIQAIDAAAARARASRGHRPRRR